jgi:hypothetical protein
LSPIGFPGPISIASDEGARSASPPKPGSTNFDLGREPTEHSRDRAQRHGSSRVNELQRSERAPARPARPNDRRENGAGSSQRDVHMLSETEGITFLEFVLGSA